MRERDFHRWEATPFGGRLRTGLLRVGFALSDALSEGDGGFVAIPGNRVVETAPPCQMRPKVGARTKGGLQCLLIRESQSDV